MVTTRKNRATSTGTYVSDQICLRPDAARRGWKSIPRPSRFFLYGSSTATGLSLSVLKLDPHGVSVR